MEASADGNLFCSGKFIFPSFCFVFQYRRYLLLDPTQKAVEAVTSAMSKMNLDRIVDVEGKIIFVDACFCFFSTGFVSQG